MLQKAIVLGLSILCLSVWTLVIVQLFVTPSPEVKATEASTRISALSHLPQLNEYEQQRMDDVVDDKAGSESTNLMVKPPEETMIHRIETNGLTKEEMVAIAIDQTISIDILLNALNLNN